MFNLLLFVISLVSYGFIQQYESLSEDEADKRENENENTEQGTKRKWSKAWDTFDFFKGANDDGDTVKCRSAVIRLVITQQMGWKYAKASKNSV